VVTVEAEVVSLRIESDADLVAARAKARALADGLGFSRTDATLIATAVSEIGRNIIVHAGNGGMEMTPLFNETKYGIKVVATDSGPGIRHPEAALEEGYAGKGGLGLGLPGVRRLVDEFTVETELDKGTVVTLVKWRLRDELERLRERRQARRG
jgi:anti-sigma regulatory factor (Ser/Thr protein kinase)